MQNIEVKARYANLDRAREISRRLGADFRGILNQSDTYFRVTDGSRLKLRQINNDRAELIRYNRPNDPSARSSIYTVEPIADPSAFLNEATNSHGILCIVKKHRELFLWQNVRIHLDQVDDLGSFIEFEGVVSSEADAGVSRQRVEQLVHEFGIVPADQIGVSYSDLLIEKTECA